MADNSAAPLVGPTDKPTTGDRPLRPPLPRWQRLTDVPPPPPGDLPIDALSHTLAHFKDSADDEMVLYASSNIYGDGIRTGLTMGHLRALLYDLNHPYGAPVGGGQRDNG